MTDTTANICWEPEIENLDRASLDALQVLRLKTTIERAAKSPFYGKFYREHAIQSPSFKQVTDIQSLPFTTKEDLRAHYPYGFLALPHEDIIRLHCSSGTTGNPAVIFHNRHDLASWANLVARSLYATGARPEDVFQNMCGYGLFTGGLGFQYGAECLGALT